MCTYKLTKAILLQIECVDSETKKKRLGWEAAISKFVTLCCLWEAIHPQRLFALWLRKSSKDSSFTYPLREKAYEYKCDAPSRKYQSVVVLCGMIQFLTQTLSSPNSSSVIFGLVSEESKNAVVSWGVKALVYVDSTKWRCASIYLVCQRRDTKQSFLRGRHTLMHGTYDGRALYSWQSS